MNINNLFVFLFFIKIWIVVSFDGEFERKTFTLKTDQLEQVYRRTAIVALLKAKAKSELHKLPPTEKILFEECEGTARTPVELAKCVRKILQERERHRGQVIIQAQVDEQQFPLQAEESWLSSALKFAMQQPNKAPNVTNSSPQHLPTLSRPRDPERYKRILRLKLNQKFRHAKKIKFQDGGNANYRIRRAIGNYQSSPRCKTPENIRSLRQVEKYFSTANECMRYIKTLGLDNSKFISSLFPLSYKNRSPGKDSASEQLKSAVSQADSGFSFLSPKILNLLPTKKENLNEKSTLLSPTLFSFHDEGVMPLPRLLKLAGSNECQTQEWIDLIMDISGASKKLDQLLDHFQKHMRNLQEDVLPKIKEFERQESLIKEINKTLTNEQKNSLKKDGYIQMNPQQLQMVYNEKGLHPPTTYFSKYKSDPNQDYFLEQTIQEMANLESSANVTEFMEKHRRNKRQVKPTKVPGLLAPYAFANQVGMPSFLGNLILSPHAFINELLNPRFLGSDIISPRAFIASTLSPFSMVSRIISPSAFRVQTLSPQALTAIVLTPEAFLAVILSPVLISLAIHQYYYNLLNFI